MYHQKQGSRSSKVTLARDVEQIVHADHPDPFSFLGVHETPDESGVTIRAFLPQALHVDVIGKETGLPISNLSKVHDEGVFAGHLTHQQSSFVYRLRLQMEHGEIEIEDPYRFPPMLGELDIHLLAEGAHLRSHEKLGAHQRSVKGVDGVNFAVWAPNARRVSVVGDFNEWDGRRHPMRLHPGCGVWEIFLPDVKIGARYKYEIKTAAGELCLKADPYAFESEAPSRTASIVHRPLNEEPIEHTWTERRKVINDRHAPIAIYEVHLGSWRRKQEEEGRYLTYRELAEQLVPYVKDMGFTHIELLPVTDYPFDGSWGYQPTALFAPTSRFGSPDDFRHFMDTCHANDIGVIADWVAGHFPSDAHGLSYFDGTHLYEHSDPREGRHKDWDTLIYNYGRNEVQNFLLSGALYWLEAFGIDGLRVDAVASMLYRNYSREDGEWIPNRFGGYENLEAIDFLRRLNEVVYASHEGVVTMAEESTAWPMVSRPTNVGGLGFGYNGIWVG